MTRLFEYARSGWVVLLFVINSLCLSPPVYAASGHAEAVPALVEMLNRDRFARPSSELEAWQTYKHQAFNAPATTAQMKAHIHLRIGVSQFYTAAYTQSLESLDRAETLALALPGLETSFWAELYAYKALALADLKQFDRAENMASAALTAAGVEADTSQTAAPSWLSALTLNAAGYQAYKAGDLDRAQPLMCRAAADARAALPLSDPLLHLNANNCGVFLYFLDDPRAIDTLEEASMRALAHLEEGHPVMGQALNTGYSVLYRLGRYPEAEALARAHMEQEVRLRGAKSSRVYDPASVLAKSLAAQGKISTAAQVQAQVISLADTMEGAGDFRARGAARLIYAKLLDQLGRFGDSAPIYRDALGHFAADFSKDHRVYILALNDYAVHLAQTGALKAALDVGQKAQDALAGALDEPHLDRISADLRYSVILARSGKRSDALKVAHRGNRLLTDQLFTLAQGRANRVSTSLLLARGFAHVAEVALRGGDEALAVEAAQLASASELTLANADIAAHASIKSQGFGDLAEALRQSRLDQQRAQQALDERLIEQRGPLQLAALAQALGEAKERTRAIEAKLDAAYPQYRQLSIPRPATKADIMRQLGPGKAIVIPLASFDTAFTLVITSKGVDWAMSDIPAHQVRIDARSLLEMVLEDRMAAQGEQTSAAAERAYALFTAVFPRKIYSALTGIDELFFIGSGPLSHVPPAMLVTQPALGNADPHWLIQEKAVAILSSFHALDTLDTPPRNTRFVGLGDPDLRGAPDARVRVAQLFRGGMVDATMIASMPPLPGAKRELRKMRKAFGRKRSELYLGDDFTQKTVSAIDFSDVSVAAFATHGLTSDETAGLTEPALVLTPPLTAANPDDSLLTASEIATLTMPVDWVILSSCNSGLGRSANAPMYSGLAKAFRMAGAKALLLSHWPVRDDAAAYLSTRAVRNAKKGLSKAQALRQAQLDLMHDNGIANTADPGLWAPFVLVAN